jgi:hypothetical protein
MDYGTYQVSDLLDLIREDHRSVCLAARIALSRIRRRPTLHNDYICAPMVIS